MNYEIELNKTLRKLKDIELAFNESSIVAITFRDENFVSELRQILKESKVDPHFIELEIT